MGIRIVQVGVGIRGAHWVEIIKGHPDVDTVAIVDRSPEAIEDAKAILADRDVDYFSDLGEALENADADAVLIATPSELHAAHAIQALEAGLAVMVEKPLATTVAEAAEVVEASRRLGRAVMVADNYRYWPAERTVRQLIQEGRVGTIDSVALIDRRDMPSETEGPWLASIEYPQLQEIAIHHFDSLRYLLDRNPTSLTVHTWNPPWSDYSHGANTEALIDFAGIMVNYLGTMRSHTFSFALWVEGEMGTLWTNRKFVFWRPRSSRFFRPVRNVKVPAGDAQRYPKGGTTSLLNALRDATTRGIQPETSSRDSIWNVAMVEAGRISDQEKRNVQIEEVLGKEVLDL